MHMHKCVYWLDNLYPPPESSNRLVAGKFEAFLWLSVCRGSGGGGGGGGEMGKVNRTPNFTF